MNRHDALRAAFGSLLLCCANSAAADGNLALAFTPDPAARGEVTGAGCYPDPGLAHGLLTPSSEAGPCETGLIGYDTGAGGFAGDVTLETAAIFESAELGSALAIGGPAVLTVRYSVTTGGMAIAGQDTASTLNYELREKYPAGHYTTIASGAAFELNPGFDRGSASFQVPEYSLSPGSRLQVLLTASGPSETRIAFGGDYSESGITLATPEAKSAGLLGAGGMSPAVLLLLSAVAAFFRFCGGVRSALGALLIFGAGTASASAETLFLAFTPDAALETDANAPSHEGCYSESGLARGLLTTSASGTHCHSGQWGTPGTDTGFAVFVGGTEVSASRDDTAHFTTPPLASPLFFAGPATLVVYYFSTSDGTQPGDLHAHLSYAIEDLGPGDPGTVDEIASGDAFDINPDGATSQAKRGEATLDLPAYTVPAGHQLRIRLTSANAPDGRVIFGDAPLVLGPAYENPYGSYADAGITLTVPDTTPDSFAFVDLVNVTPGATITSAARVISGIEAPAPVSVGGAASSEYSVGCDGTFTSAPGSIANGQAVCVRHRAASTFDTVTSTSLTVGGVSAWFNSTTLARDTTPNPFAFSDSNDVPRAATVTSNAVTISGINDAAPVSVSGGQYSVGCTGTFSSSSGSIANGQAICVRHAASSAFATATRTTLTVGGIAGVFTSTTVAQDTTPDPFRFTDRNDVTRGALVISNAVTISGINDAAPVSVAGGEYSIGCNGTFSAGAGSVGNGQTICVRQVASASYATGVDTVLTVGGVSDTFTSTTAAAPAPATTAESDGGAGSLSALSLLALSLATRLGRRQRRTAIAGCALIIGVCVAACGPSPEPEAGRSVPADEARLVRITGGNPFLDLPGCGPNTFFGSNFEGAEVEPMVAVSPADPDDLAATWFQDASLTYVTAVSRDGGRNWQTVPVPGISACDGGTAQAGADSWVSIGPDASVYLSGFSVHLDALPVPLPTRTTMQVSRGTFAPDDGIAWSAPSVVQAGAGVFHDRPVVTADPTQPGRAYVLWNDGTQVPPAVVQPLMFATSGDGGLTWSTPSLVHMPPAGISHEGRIHALADGALLATFMVNATHPFTHQLLSKRSEDGGQTWQAVPTTIAEIPAGAATAVNGDCRTLAAPIRDADHGPRCVQMPEQELSADVAPDGAVFATWAQRVADDQSEIRVSRSVDGGRTWLPPVSVSPAAGEKAIPALAIAADGTVGVAWYDFRSDVAGDGLFSGEVWFAQSSDDGASWREERLAGPFDMNTAPYRLIPVEGLFLGDYFGLVPVTGGFGAVFAAPAPYAVEGTTDLFFAKVRVSPGRKP